MKINADFDQRVLVHSRQMEWQDSPITGVSRRPLDRVGAEVARATSIVRYAPGSYFSPHVHVGGEEFVVLEGVFQDEQGDFPVGSYIRNPPKSSHTPGSKKGCVIFVKLWQFEPTDRTHVRINFNMMRAVPHRDLGGVSISPLYEDENEEVSVHHWAPFADVKLDLPYGGEFLVLDGDFSEGGNRLKKQSWLRLPVGSRLNAKAGETGTKVWVKQNHLHSVEQQIEHLSIALAS